MESNRRNDFTSQKLLLKETIENRDKMPLPYTEDYIEHEENKERHKEDLKRVKKDLENLQKNYYNYRDGFGHWAKVLLIGAGIFMVFLIYFYFGLMAASINQDVYKCNPKYDKDCNKITQEVVVLDDNINAD